MVSQAEAWESVAAAAGLDADPVRDAAGVWRIDLVRCRAANVRSDGCPAAFPQHHSTVDEARRGLLVGAMLAFDMGGPVNKTAWFFCFSLLEKHIYDWYAIVGVVALMPPVAAGIATYLAPKLFTEQEKAAASSAIVVGATVATEPAIPYALAAPYPC